MVAQRYRHGTRASARICLQIVGWLLHFICAKSPNSWVTSPFLLVSPPFLMVSWYVDNIYLLTQLDSEYPSTYMCRGQNMDFRGHPSHGNFKIIGQSTSLYIPMKMDWWPCWEQTIFRWQKRGFCWLNLPVSASARAMKAAGIPKPPKKPKLQKPRPWRSQLVQKSPKKFRVSCCRSHPLYPLTLTVEFWQWNSWNSWNSWNRMSFSFAQTVVPCTRSMSFEMVTTEHCRTCFASFIARTEWWRVEGI